VIAVAWINNLNINCELGKPTHDARHSRGFVPLEMRAGGKPKALLATGMINHVLQDADRLIALCIVLRNDPDIARRTDASVDRVPA